MRSALGAAASPAQVPCSGGMAVRAILRHPAVRAIAPADSPPPAPLSRLQPIPPCAPLGLPPCEMVPPDHFDHFMGMFSNRLPELINNQGFEVCSVEEQEGDDAAPPTAVVIVAVQPAAGKQQQQQGEGQLQRFEFQLRRKTVGARKGSLMTFMVRRVQE